MRETPGRGAGSNLNEVEGVDNLVLDDLILLMGQLEQKGVKLSRSLSVDDLSQLAKMLAAIAQRLDKPLAKYGTSSSASKEITMGQILDGLEAYKAKIEKKPKGK